jgi:prepilin-type N-terminal cleavage/methylation domain-containing protein
MGLIRAIAGADGEAMRPSLRTRLISEESGYTLIELLIVLIILSILTAIALPTYLSFKNRANATAAAANVRAVVPDIEAYNADNYASAPTAQDPDWNGTDAAGVGTNADSGYAGLTLAILQSKYDGSIVANTYQWDPAGWAPVTGQTTSTDYCVYSLVGTRYAAKHGPNGSITTGAVMHLGGAGALPDNCYAAAS